MALFSVTVIADNRLGLVADIMNSLASMDGNLESSKMNIFGGHFVWSFLVDVPVEKETLWAGLLPICPEGVKVTEMPIPGETTVEAVVTQLSQPILENVITMDVRGIDHPGIVSSIARWVAQENGNILSMETQAIDGNYFLVADIEFYGIVDIAQLVGGTKKLSQQLDVVIRLQR